MTRIRITAALMGALALAGTVTGLTLTGSATAGTPNLSAPVQSDPSTVTPVLSWPVEAPAPTTTTTTAPAPQPVVQAAPTGVAVAPAGAPDPSTVIPAQPPAIGLAGIPDGGCGIAWNQNQQDPVSGQWGVHEGEFYGSCAEADLIQSQFPGSVVVVGNGSPAPETCQELDNCTPTSDGSSWPTWTTTTTTS